ncbi:unnamed protein product [Cylicocyclus nassatus]|uniref:ETS domain-containing protein n=1 Tax=Cylicocyclus nassatus TaxID=53992 RepID=A0AA36DV91_CYLNA|nr:unnamed protein product [Cylicocyclus nassatus]
MFASYLTNSMYPRDATKFSKFFCMPMFTPQGPMLPAISPNTSPSPSNTSSISDDAEMNAHDCSSGYSSLDESWATLSPYLQMFQLRQFAYSPPYFPFWYRQWSSPSLTTEQSSECKKSLGFPPEYDITPLRPFTPAGASAGLGNEEFSPIPIDKQISPICRVPTTRLGTPSQRHPTCSKTQRSLMLLEMIVYLLHVNTDIIEWISTTSPEFRILDRKKFVAHWNRLSGKQDSFIAIACKLRGVGNEKMQTTDGQKIRLITRTAPYTYRFLPDQGTSSFPMLHDHILQQLITKMLLSFHLHQRKCKNDAESATFCH